MLSRYTRCMEHQQHQASTYYGTMGLNPGWTSRKEKWRSNKYINGGWIYEFPKCVQAACQNL